MEEYLLRNKETYEAAAEEFRGKIPHRKVITESFVADFCSTLSGLNPRKTTILELGPGSGYTSKLLIERGFDVSAIEISQKMADVAVETAPPLKMIVDEFKSHDFGSTRYNAIIGIAFIHLFPGREIPTLLNKINNLLVKNGILHLSTTVHLISEEGFFTKNNFKGKYLRFRKRFTEEEFKNYIEAAGFNIQKVFFVEDDEEKDKRWMNIIATKK